jgi:phosphate starvation-inducible PhoH-like protein
MSSGKRIDIIPRSINQEHYIDALENENVNIVLSTGPAGTGKTYVAMLYAFKQLQEGNIDKIAIIRPTVSVGSNAVGFLPGTLLEKLSPWARAIIDVAEEIHGKVWLEKALASETIEILGIAFLRGRSIKRTIIILDEAQNTSIEEMKMILTRIGEGSKLIVNGDMNQHDRGNNASGLIDFTKRLDNNGSDRIKLVRFSRVDIQRHPVVSEVLGLYGED